MEIKFKELHFMEICIYSTKIKKFFILTLQFFKFNCIFLKHTKKIHFCGPPCIYIYIYIYIYIHIYICSRTPILHMHADSFISETRIFRNNFYSPRFWKLSKLCRKSINYSENPAKLEKIRDYRVLPSKHSRKIHHIFRAHTNTFWNLCYAM